jgi:hypothetical protein
VTSSADLTETDAKFFAAVAEQGADLRLSGNTTYDSEEPAS